MLQAQSLVYWTYKITTFRAVLQTTLRHQKQARKQQTFKTFSQKLQYNDNLNVTILQNNIKTAAAWICKLKALARHDLNTEIGNAEEMYIFYLFRNELCHKFRY